MMKKKVALIVLVCVFWVSVGTANALSSFSDAKSTDWFYKDLQYILSDSRKIINGFPDGTFKPSGKLTAEQFVKMVVCASGYELKATQGQKWSDPYFDKAIELGYISASDFYNRAANITRGEMAKIVVNAVVKITGEYEYRDAEKIKVCIRDYSLIGNGFKDAVVKVYDLGIIGGYPDGEFKVNNVLTRAEGTAVMRRLIDVSARKVLNFEGIRDGVYRVNPDIPSELYDFPYSTDSEGEYLTNNWMIERYGLDKVEDFMNIGKGYVEDYYNVDYKTLDRTEFVEKIQWYFMPQIKWRADDGVTRTIEDHFAYWADMIQEKQLQIDMEFTTDPSLVYSDGDTIIRGMATFTVKSCNDMVSLANYTRFGKGIQLGKTYSRVIEIEVINMANSDGWDHAERVLSNEYFLSAAKEEVTK